MGVKPYHSSLKYDSSDESKNGWIERDVADELVRIEFNEDEDEEEEEEEVEEEEEEEEEEDDEEAVRAATQIASKALT